ncbi:uncharacterized protein [Parasteatoda tepidariorum]|uniref:uncharacterized protein isoform X1 n=1 Tax=Parasteatoda tepidariorum TaxID=114398 RepID=UPI001C71E2CB|nr:uncharacterized protein LOC107445538 isoform X1 [Parasteatoda tepidariorum]
MNYRIVPSKSVFLIIIMTCQELNYATQRTLQRPWKAGPNFLTAKNDIGTHLLRNMEFQNNLNALTKVGEKNGKQVQDIPELVNVRTNKRSIKIKKSIHKRGKNKSPSATNTMSYDFLNYFNSTRVYDSKHWTTITNQNMMTQKSEISDLKTFLEKSNEIQKAIEAPKDEDFLRIKVKESSDEMISALVNFGSDCDRIDRQACWFVRGIGDTLTLGINISISKEFKEFSIQWRKIYKQRQKKKAMNIKIEADRLPWNMVLGSEGRELRLNPITNSDVDPNRISAKVYQVVQTESNVEKYHLIKELKFRIDVPPIDMGRVYYGEELNINMENFLTLPEKGNLDFEWSVEKPEGDKESLPSNVKISSSGRSIIVKELKNGQMKTISCVVFSLNGIAIAKRRFKIRELVSQDDMRRKSVSRRGSQLQEDNEDSYFFDDSPHKKCLLVQNKNVNVNDFMKPISRRKRYRKDSKILPLIYECLLWKSHQRLHPRWVPHKYPFTNNEPRLKSIEELIELSEDSDGTLDDVIPHEVHFVEPKVRIVKDSVFENSRYVNFRHCLTDLDCGRGAFCIIPKDQKELDVAQNTSDIGFCYCKREYFADGIICKKIPLDKHRGKRIKRNVLRTEDIEVVPRLFYSQRDVSSIHNSVIERDTDEIETTLKNPTFEEEESYLLSSCHSNKDCSQHATCDQVHNRDHSSCKCDRGYRGMGIFCWEIMDYVEEELMDKRRTKIDEETFME